MEKKSEFQKFDQTMESLLKVPHSQIRQALETEKLNKKKKREKANDIRNHEHDSGK